VEAGAAWIPMLGWWSVLGRIQWWWAGHTKSGDAALSSGQHGEDSADGGGTGGRRVGRQRWGGGQRHNTGGLKIKEVTTFGGAV
jgi:hypothetical protein